MKDYIIQLIHTIDGFCNVIFWFWIVYFATFALREKRFPTLKKRFAISFLLSFLGVLFIPNETILRQILN